jgi:hypothetical protein
MSTSSSVVDTSAFVVPASHIILAEKFELLHVLLALLYALTLVLLWVHKLLRWSLTERPSFNVVLSAGLAMRATWLVTQNYVFDGRFGRMHGWHGFYFVLNTLPNFCFFTCYLTILFLWGRVLHRQNVAADDRHGATRHRFRRIFFAINAFMYAALCSLYIADYYELGSERAFAGVALLTVSEHLVMILDALVYICLIIAYLIYGILFWSQLANRRARMSTVRRRILRKVQLLTAVVAVCFSLRLAIILWSMLSVSWATWYFDALYFGLLELLPLVVALFIIHWRVDDSAAAAATIGASPAHHVVADSPWRRTSPTSNRITAANNDNSRPWWSSGPLSSSNIQQQVVDGSM